MPTLNVTLEVQGIGPVSGGIVTIRNASTLAIVENITTDAAGVYSSSSSLAFGTYLVEGILANYEMIDDIVVFNTDPQSLVLEFPIEANVHNGFYGLSISEPNSLTSITEGKGFYGLDIERQNSFIGNNGENGFYGLLIERSTPLFKTGIANGFYGIEIETLFIACIRVVDDFGVPALATVTLKQGDTVIASGQTDPKTGEYYPEVQQGNTYDIFVDVCGNEVSELGVNINTSDCIVINYNPGCIALSVYDPPRDSVEPFAFAPFEVDMSTLDRCLEPCKECEDCPSLPEPTEQTYEWPFKAGDTVRLILQDPIDSPGLVYLHKCGMLAWPEPIGSVTRLPVSTCSWNDPTKARITFRIPSIQGPSGWPNAALQIRFMASLGGNTAILKTLIGPDNDGFASRNRNTFFDAIQPLFTPQEQLDLIQAYTIGQASFLTNTTAIATNGVSIDLCNPNVVTWVEVFSGETITWVPLLPPNIIIFKPECCTTGDVFLFEATLPCFECEGLSFAIGTSDKVSLFISFDKFSINRSGRPTMMLKYRNERNAFGVPYSNILGIYQQMRIGVTLANPQSIIAGEQYQRTDGTFKHGNVVINKQYTMRTDMIEDHQRDFLAVAFKHSDVLLDEMPIFVTQEVQATEDFLEVTNLASITATAIMQGYRKQNFNC